MQSMTSLKLYASPDPTFTIPTASLSTDLMAASTTSSTYTKSLLCVSARDSFSSVFALCHPYTSQHGFRGVACRPSEIRQINYLDTKIILDFHFENFGDPGKTLESNRQIRHQ
jgi:hypothetical protein